MMSTVDHGGNPASLGDDAETCDELAALLVRAVLALGKAGQPVEAMRIAAKALSVTRQGYPVAARRINGVMHTLSPLADPPSTIVDESKR